VSWELKPFEMLFGREKAKAKAVGRKEGKAVRRSWEARAYRKEPMGGKARHEND